MKWVIFQRNSVLLTSAIATILVLDLAKPGYRHFALIPELKPTLAIATSTLGKTATSLTAALTTAVPFEPQSKVNPTTATPTPKPCTRLLDAYRQGASQCKEFTLPTY